MTAGDAANGATAPTSEYVDAAFYARLAGYVEAWATDGVPVDEETLRSCERFLYREARLIDDGRFEEWLDSFTPECLYWIPMAAGGGDPMRQVSLAFDDRRRLEDRVFWLRTGYVWSQIPPSRTRRLIANVEAVHGTTPEEVLVRSNFALFEAHPGRRRHFAGWYGHVLDRREDGTWGIRVKQVNLIDCDQPQGKMTVLL